VLNETWQWVLIFTAMDIALYFFRVHGVRGAVVALGEKVAVNTGLAFSIFFVLACLGWAFGFIKDEKDEE